MADAAVLQPAAAPAAAPPVVEAAAPEAPAPVAAAADDAMDDDDLGFVFVPQTITVEAQAADAELIPSNVWTVSIRPKSDLYRKANETALLLRELSRLGPIKATLDDSHLPELDELDPEAAYVTWSVRVETEEDEAAIREVFEFVDGDCDLEITRALFENYGHMNLGLYVHVTMAGKVATGDAARMKEQS